MARPQLTLHIGMGKTGTTALQHFFAQNRDALLGKGVDYPDYNCIEGAHHRLSPHIPPFLAHHWKFLDVAEWGPDLSARETGSLLLSSELISSARPPVVADFARRVREMFDVRIVIYFRRQDNLITSAYNQQIKAGTLTAPFAEMLERQFPNFDFMKKLEPWEKGFGKENIVVVPYERRQFHEGDIRKDFLHRIFGITDFTGLVFEETERNPGLAFSAAEFKRLVNAVFRHPDRANFFNDVLQDYSVSPLGAGGRPAISPAPPALHLQLLRRCEEINSTIAREYLGREDGRLFYEDEPVAGPRTDPPELTTDELVRIIRFVREHQPELIEMLQAGIDEAAEANRFESYFAGCKLEAGINHDKSAGISREAGTV